MDIPWWYRAACRRVPIDSFPDDEAVEPVLAAWCRTHCPVIDACREDALACETAVGSSHGVAGGMTATERRVVVRMRQDSRGALIDEFLEEHPLLSVRALARLIRREGGADISYRTLARRRAELVARLPA